MVGHDGGLGVKTQLFHDMSSEAWTRFRGAIDLAIRHAIWHCRITANDARDFEAECWLYVLEHEHALVDTFRGEAQPTTYFATVFTNLYLMKCRSEQGRWRPSARARRLGPAAEALERLVYRDGYTAANAAAMVHTANPKGPTRDELETLVASLPFPRRLTFRPTSSAPGVRDPETLLCQREAAEQARTLQTALRQALAALPHSDRCIVEWKYLSGWSAARIGAALGLTRGRVYDRLAVCRDRLRDSLIAAGFSKDTVVAILNGPGLDGPDAKRERERERETK